MGLLTVKFRVYCLGFRACCFGYRLYGLGFRLHCFGFRVQVETIVFGEKVDKCVPRGSKVSRRSIHCQRVS